MYMNPNLDVRVNAGEGLVGDIDDKKQFDNIVLAREREYVSKVELVFPENVHADLINDDFRKVVC